MDFSGAKNRGERRIFSGPILPAEFRKIISGLLGREERDFFDCVKRPLKRSIRVNPLKARKSEAIGALEEEGFELRKVGWANAFVLENESEELKAGNTLGHFRGDFYVQELVSMIPALALGAERGERVLDLAAAPGSKTTQICGKMMNTGAIAANEPNQNRMKMLKNNLEKMGCLNVIGLGRDGRSIGLKGEFDRVLVDAPCSSQGTMRKDWNVLSRWSPALVAGFSGLQKALLQSAISCAKTGGTIVYSTCTFSPEENEEVVDWALKKGNVELVDFEVKGLRARPGLVEWNGKRFDGSLSRCIRIYPHLNDTGGFFVAKMRKVEEEKERKGREKMERPIPASEEGRRILFEEYGLDLPQETFLADKGDLWLASNEARAFAEKIGKHDFLGMRALRKGNLWKPTTAFCQLLGEHAEKKAVELKKEEAIEFARGKSVDAGASVAAGFCIARFNGKGLGCGLAKEGKVESLVPKGFRLN